MRRQQGRGGWDMPAAVLGGEYFPHDTLLLLCSFLPTLASLPSHVLLRIPTASYGETAPDEHMAIITNRVPFPGLLEQNEVGVQILSVPRNLHTEVRSELISATQQAT